MSFSLAGADAHSTSIKISNVIIAEWETQVLTAQLNYIENSQSCHTVRLKPNRHAHSI